MSEIIKASFFSSSSLSTAVVLAAAYHREGLCVIDSREMPASLAAWKILPSTSILTALVHSSKSAYLGLERTQETRFCIAYVRCSRSIPTCVTVFACIVESTAKKLLPYRLKTIHVFNETAKTSFDFRLSAAWNLFIPLMWLFKLVSVFFP